MAREGVSILAYLHTCTLACLCVQDSLEREDAEALITKYGGRVTSAVSGKTSYLLCGIDSNTGNRMEGSKTQKVRRPIFSGV